MVIHCTRRQLLVPQQGEVTLSQSCTPETIQPGTTECDVVAVNNAFEDTVVDLRTEVNERLRLTGAEGAVVVDDRHAERTDVPLAGAQPGVPDVVSGELFGYSPSRSSSASTPNQSATRRSSTSAPLLEFAGQED